MEYKFDDDTQDKKYFTIVPNYILNHSSAIEQSLYLQMKRAAGENGVCFMTQKTLCKKLGIGKDKFRIALQYLIKYNWIEFIGTTESKTRPINTYKINDIWQLNTEYYQNKKKSPESDISLKKDKSYLDLMIRSGNDPIRRTNNKEELNNTDYEAKASVFKEIKPLKDILSKHIIRKEKKKGGVTYEWQDTATRMWVKLGLTGNIPSGWFKMFKTNVVLAEHACSWVSDSGGYDLEKLSYWAFNQLRKNGKITYEKLSDTVQHLHT